VARQASSPSLCASVQAVPWADEAEQQLSRLVPSGLQLSADVRVFWAGLQKEPGRDPLQSQATSEVRCCKTSMQRLSQCLCASSAMGRWDWATAFQTSPFWLPAICRRSHFQIWAAKGAWQGPPPILGYVWSLRWQDKQAAPVSVPLCK